MSAKYQEESLDKVPGVSVIVPIYNVEKYLEECVDSILEQTFRDMEVILVDDGSVDHSGEMADEYAARDKRVRVIHKENGGQSSARNAGLKAARGEYIYFCDSDDYISLNAIEVLYDTATRNNLDLVLFNGDAFWDRTDTANESLRQKAYFYKNYYKRRIDYGGVNTGTELFVKMSAANEYRASICLQFIRRTYITGKHLLFYEGIIYEDNLYSLEALLLADRVMFIPKSFFHRRVRGGSTMTSQETFKNFYGYFVVYCETIRFLSKYEFEVHVLKEAEEVLNCVYKAEASRIWKNLPESEKAGFRERLPMIQRVLFDEILDNEKSENRKLRKELRDIRYSNSFRIGRIVTWLPRKVCGGINCFREHGLAYTAKRALKHFGIDMGIGEVRRWK